VNIQKFQPISVPPTRAIMTELCDHRVKYELFHGYILEFSLNCISIVEHPILYSVVYETSFQTQRYSKLS
jgi:hypothetical protein